MRKLSDNNLNYMTVSGNKSKGLTPDQKRIHWEAYAKKTEREEEVFKKVFDNVFNEQKDLVLENLDKIKSKGGEGSGNFGHEGRPGEVGGSGEGGGGVNPAHTAHDNLYNEGGEGYNPHPEYIESPHSEPSANAKRDSINRKLNAIDYNAPENQERISALRQEYDQSYVKEGWTREATAERRGKWNSAVKSGKYNNSEGKISATSRAKLEEDMGFDIGTLKEAIRIHGG